MITFIDSNIFVSAFDRAYPVKQRLALARIEQARANGTVALSTQVLHEFYNICRRKIEPELTHEQASLAVNIYVSFWSLEARL
jgi:predicted nucleic acid-binding protein